MLLEKPLRVRMEDDSSDWITLDTNRAFKLQRCLHCTFRPGVGAVSAARTAPVESRNFAETCCMPCSWRCCRRCEHAAATPSFTFAPQLTVPSADSGMEGSGEAYERCSHC